MFVCFVSICAYFCVFVCWEENDKFYHLVFGKTRSVHAMSLEHNEPKLAVRLVIEKDTFHRASPQRVPTGIVFGDEEGKRAEHHKGHTPLD